MYLSDADEFIDRSVWSTFVGDVLALPSKRHYYWTVDWEFTTGIYQTAPFLAKTDMLVQLANWLRYSADIPHIPAGWEFSFLGGIKFAQEKIKSYSHDELNRDDVLRRDRLYWCIRDGRDPSPDRGAQLVGREPDDPSLPQWLLDNPDWIHERSLSRYDWGPEADCVSSIEPT